MFKTKPNTIRKIKIFILSTILLVSGFSMIQNRPYSKGFHIWGARTDLYNQVSMNIKRDNVVVSFAGQIGIYYFTGINTLSILRGPEPNALAILKPLIEAPDIGQGLQYLLHYLNVDSLIIRTEQGGLYREWYVNLLNELPELRILYNPNLFETILYSPKYFYFLKLVNESWRPYGVLDVVVRGEDSRDEDSLLFPCDYGEWNHTFITYSEKGVELVIFLYFPLEVFTDSIDLVSYNITTKLTIIDSFNDQDEKRTKVITSSSLINLSKIVQIEACLLKGNINAENTAISLDEIEINMKADNFKAYFHLIPKNETWIGYYPKGLYNWDAHVWIHRGSNLIENNSILESSDS